MSGKRATLDNLIRSCAVDLFHSIGVAVAPVEHGAMRPEDIRYHELTAGVGFTARGFTGVMTFGVPTELVSLVKQDGLRPHNPRDWVREMVNQLCGRLKGKLMPFQTSIKVGLPSLVTQEFFERQRTRGKFYAAYLFRTLRGHLVVTIAGDIDEGLQPFLGDSKVASEGDILIFD